MFTGLVEEVGVVRRLERGSEAARLVIGARKVLEGTRIGDSIAVSGACLTVTHVGRDEFGADCMAETLSRTTLATAAKGTQVNLERALAVGGRLGGHLVLGHVDSVVAVTGVQRRQDSLEVSMTLPDAVAPFVAEKGSVTIDGVSLTVIRVGAHDFVVGLIPHTIGETTLRAVQKGVFANLEADVIARYVQRYLRVGTAGADAEDIPSEGLTMELLRDKGFA